MPFRRYRKKVPHRSDLIKWPIGRYPQKAAKEILLVLENAEQNSSFKGLEVSRLRITHMAAQRGKKIRGFTRYYKRLSIPRDQKRWGGDLDQ